MNSHLAFFIGHGVSISAAGSVLYDINIVFEAVEQGELDWETACS
jgi:hypothetical protein